MLKFKSEKFQEIKGREFAWRVKKIAMKRQKMNLKGIENPVIVWSLATLLNTSLTLKFEDKALQNSQKAVTWKPTAFLNLS